MLDMTDMTRDEVGVWCDDGIRSLRFAFFFLEHLIFCYLVTSLLLPLVLCLSPSSTLCSVSVSHQSATLR